MDLLACFFLLVAVIHAVSAVFLLRWWKDGGHYLIPSLVCVAAWCYWTSFVLRVCAIRVGLV